MKILVSDVLSPEGLAYLRQQEGLEVVDRPGLSPEELKHEIRDAAGLIVRSKTRVTAEVIAQAAGLKVIGRAGAGVDNIDLEAATRRGIVVMNTPGGNSVSAAEHAFALLIALARRLPAADASLRAGQWDKSKFIGHELCGKLLGVVGLGRIGSILARRAQGFDLKVLGYDPFVTEKYARDLGVELVDLEDLLRRCDFLSLHLPLTDQTRGLINRSALTWMKPTACLVNAARGGLVVEEDLAEALEKGQLAGAALDVFEKEPRIHPRLLATDRVILTPHIAGSTREAQAQVGYGIAVQVANFLTSQIIVNAVNFPSLSPKELAQISPYLRLGEKLGAFVSQISATRIDEIGIRYYGELTGLDHKPISNYILTAVLRLSLSEGVNEVNARSYAAERGIAVVETVSSRQRSHTNLISIQLRSDQGVEWVEGAILHQGKVWLVSVDGIPVEAPLGDRVLFIRNDDKPGVIGQVGTILGTGAINIASFVLGRSEEQSHAVGVVNTDSAIPEEVLTQIQQIPAVRFARVVQL